MNEDLKRCPFCGGTPECGVEYNRDRSYETEIWLFAFVRCSECKTYKRASFKGAEAYGVIPFWDYEKAFDKVIKDWNTRDDVCCKTGHWIEVHDYVTPGGDPVWRCSECGKGDHVYGVEHITYGADISDGQWVACPNCGARMEGEE